MSALSSSQPDVRLAASMKKPIASMTDKDELGRLMRNAKRLDRLDVYEEAFRRRCELEGVNTSDRLHARFMEVLAAYEGLLEEKHGRRQPAGRTRQKMARLGVEQCLIDWATDHKPSSAFDLLRSRDMLHLTAEYVITQFPERFTHDVILAAQRRLEGL